MLRGASGSTELAYVGSSHTWKCKIWCLPRSSFDVPAEALSSWGWGCRTSLGFYQTISKTLVLRAEPPPEAPQDNFISLEVRFQHKNDEEKIPQHFKLALQEAFFSCAKFIHSFSFNNPQRPNLAQNQQKSKVQSHLTQLQQRMKVHFTLRKIPLGQWA